MTGENTFLEELSLLLKVEDLTTIDPNANLFDLGLLDSFGVVALAELLDKHVGPIAEIDMEDLENLNSLSKIRSVISQ